jgi:hypothetical protein
MRIAIREFVVHFGRLFDMSRAQLEVLERIGRRRPHKVDDTSSDSEQDIEVEIERIGETFPRAILLGLLKILVAGKGRSPFKAQLKRSEGLVPS